MKNKKQFKILEAKQIVFSIAVIGLLFLLISPIKAAQINLPKDAEGWTIFTPSADSRIVYVSTSGNDGSCTYYDSTIAGGVRTPTSVIPCATFSHAQTLTRNGYPDWILFKRGDVFNFGLGLNTLRSGRSATEPSLISYYGNGGAVPLFKTGGQGGFSQNDDNGLQWVTLSGLDFYSDIRDPDSPSFVSSTVGKSGFDIKTNSLRTSIIEGLLIEGCKFQFYNNNVIQNATNETVSDNILAGITLYRNVISDNYALYGHGHSQGLFLGNVDYMDIRQCIFDHNGWLIPDRAGDNDGEATGFNHNLYASGIHNSNIINNIFSRGSNSGSKFTSTTSHNTDYSWTKNINTNDTNIQNNLYYDNAVSISIGANHSSNQPDGRERRFKNLAIQNNIITHASYTMPYGSLRWGIWLHAMDVADISENIITNGNTAIGNAFCFGFDEGSNAVDIHNNICYHDESRGFDTGPDIYPEAWVNVKFYNNDIQNTTNSRSIIRVGTDTSDANIERADDIIWANNKYSAGGQALGFSSKHTNYNFANWQTLTGDTSTETQVTTYPHPNRDILTYLSSVGETSSHTSFINHIKAQDRYNWDTKYTAPVVNEYIRAGFTSSTNIRADVDQNSTINSTDALLTLRNSLGLDMSSTNWQTSSTTGDVNCDSSTNSTDALLILRHSLGLGMSGTGWCEE